MKFPVILEKKKDKYGDRVFDAFCPLFHDARTFSPCDDKRDAIEEVQEIIQDEVDELLDTKKPLPTLPKAEELKKKYKDLKVVWVPIETDVEDDEEDYEGEDDDIDEDDEEGAVEDYDEEIDDMLDDEDDDEE